MVVQSQGVGGGQGRSPRDVQDSAWALWCALVVAIAIALVVGVCRG